MNKKPNPRPWQNLVLWLLAAVTLLWAYANLAAPAQHPADAAALAAPAVSYTKLLRDAETGLVESVNVSGDNLAIAYRDGSKRSSVNPGDAWLVSDMKKSGVEVSAKSTQSAVPGPGASSSKFGPLDFLFSFGPVLLIVGVMLYIYRKQTGAMGAGKGGQMGFGKANVRKSTSSDATFADVAGCDEAKEEVAEIVEFLRDPEQYQKLGGRIPKGVLLSGPPGTGKTLLAKAIAGEAKVPFLSMSGSGFVEMFVGVGAARVRDLFEQAKALAPCIIFVDEIDAVGRHRGAGVGGGNDEREQTLNQMLVEMDGYEPSLGVIVLAATNRPDILDPALLRPGRFDRQVHVALPDIRGREQILEVHLRKVPVAPVVEPRTLARGTPGFSGADLANLVNEAALFAARRKALHLEMRDFEDAKDKVMMGAERKSVIMPEEERRNTAYHEAGHAVIARLLPKTDPVHKVTIIPRGRALGVTMQLPETDRYSTDKQRLESTIAMLYGGRVAEELFMGQATTGASNDFERATLIARNMVTRWGYSEVLGPMVLASNETDPTAAQLLSPETLREVDNEIRSLLRAQYARVQVLLNENADKMHVMANALLEWETIDADQVNDIMEGREPRQPKYLRAPRAVALPSPTHGAKGGAPTPAVA